MHFNFKINRTLVCLRNTVLSQSFNIERGMRQRCPLSSVILIVLIEILSNYILTNPNIKGIQTETLEIKQTLFADGATYLNNGNETSFKILFDNTCFQTSTQVIMIVENILTLKIAKIAGKKHLTYLKCRFSQ